MDVKMLADIPPWEWPDNARRTILDVLRNSGALPADRLLAAELAGQIVVIDDEGAEALLAIVGNGAEPDDLRGQAAISLGPALEEADTMGYDDPADVVISRSMFGIIQRRLHALFTDAGVPTEVRRRVLEASVRAPEAWHQGALRAAWASDDAAWKLTAVFGMAQMPGFEQEILDALNSPDPDIRAQAVEAAGNQDVAAAWPCILSILESPRPDKDLLLVAIGAAAAIRPEEASEVLAGFLESTNEEVVAATEEALAMARGLSGELEDEDRF